MTLYYGEAPSPSAFAIAWMESLGVPVSAERDEDTPLPSFVVNAVAGSDDRHLMTAIISVHTFADTPAAADALAWKAHYRWTSLTPGDTVTFVDGTTAQPGWPSCDQIPVYQPYRDPYIKRYYGRYRLPLRFRPTT